MVAVATEEAIHTLNIVKERVIEAPIEITFEALLEELGPASAAPDGTPFPLVLEAWPGGRWFRDLGDKTGHFWGHVQVIKPPKLLEICGPMFMSYPAINHLEIKLEQISGGTSLKLRHRAIGMISDEHREGVSNGWKGILEGLKADFVEAAKASS